VTESLSAEAQPEAVAFKWLNKLKNKPYMACLKRKAAAS
jgi:hypothetical protein